MGPTIRAIQRWIRDEVSVMDSVETEAVFASVKKRFSSKEFIAQAYDELLYQFVAQETRGAITGRRRAVRSKTGLSMGIRERMSGWKVNVSPRKWLSLLVCTVEDSKPDIERRTRNIIANTKARDLIRDLSIAAPDDHTAFGSMSDELLEKAWEKQYGQSTSSKRSHGRQ